MSLQEEEFTYIQPRFHLIKVYFMYMKSYNMVYRTHRRPLLKYTFPIPSRRNWFQSLMRLFTRLRLTQWLWGNAKYITIFNVDIIENCGMYQIQKMLFFTLLFLKRTVPITFVCIGYIHFPFIMHWYSYLNS